MPYDYNPIAATAKRLIDNYGQSVTWRKITDNPGLTPWNGNAGSSTTEYVVRMAFVPTGRVGHETVARSANEQRKGAVSGLMAQVAFKPSAKDIVIRNGKSFVVKSIEEICPATTTVLYQIEFEA